MMQNRFFFLSCLLLAFCGIAAVAQTAGPDLTVLTNAQTPFIDGDQLVFLGDSITQFGDGPEGYVGLMRAAFTQAAHPAVTVINAGISGNKVPDLQSRLQGDVLAKNPSIVFIYIGINDVWHHNGDLGAPKDIFEKGLREIITTLQQRGIIVVLATPSVIGEKGDGSNPLDHALDVFSDTSRTIAKEMHLELCDLRLAFTSYLKTNNTDGKTSGILTSDSVHLSVLGNRLVAEEAAKSLVAALNHAGPIPSLTGEDFLDTATTCTIGFRPQQDMKGITFRYTLDGSDPQPKSRAYKKPLLIKDTTTVKVCAFRKKEPVSAVIVRKLTKLTPLPAVTPGVVEPGLTYQTFEGNWPALPDFSTLTPAEHGSTTVVDLSVTDRTQNYGLLFTGYLEIPATGIYTFTTNSDDGSKLWVDGTLVVDNDGMHAPRTLEGRVALAPGKHAITIAFSQGGGGQALSVAFGALHQPLQPLPPAALFHAPVK